MGRIGYNSSAQSIQNDNMSVMDNVYVLSVQMLQLMHFLLDLNEIFSVSWDCLDKSPTNQVTCVLESGPDRAQSFLWDKVSNNQRIIWYALFTERIR